MALVAFPKYSNILVLRNFSFIAGVTCGHLFNADFDQELVDYRPGYENSLLRGRAVVEIGCGRSEFLRTLCCQGNNRGIGFDPRLQSVSDIAAVGWLMASGCVSMRTLQHAGIFSSRITGRVSRQLPQTRHM
jgi:hypothetical protein